MEIFVAWVTYQIDGLIDVKPDAGSRPPQGQQKKQEVEGS